MKRALIILLALTVFTAAPGLVFAGDVKADSVQSQKMPQLQVTDDQKAKAIALKTQLLELKKQILKQNLENGTLTKEQYQKMEARINARLKALESGDLSPFHRRHAPKSKS